MQSAPAHIPAITVLSFGAGLADPDLILGSAYPAHDTDAHHRTPQTPRRTYATLAPEVPFRTDRLMPEEHQSFQLRGHFPRYDTR
jgi:hypothetical protein